MSPTIVLLLAATVVGVTLSEPACAQANAEQNAAPNPYRHDVGWLKPLVAKAGGMINGASEAEADVAQPQSDVDMIMSN